MKKPNKPEPINRNFDAYAANNARVAATLDLKDLSDRERAFLATCQRIHRRERGCDSPFEEFFWRLVISVEMNRWPTPDDIADELETFRENFEYMQQAVRNFAEAYPEKRVAPGVKQAIEAAHA